MGKKHIEVEKINLKEGSTFLVKDLSGMVLGIGKAVGIVTLKVVGMMANGTKIYKNEANIKEKIHVHKGTKGVINTLED